LIAGLIAGLIALQAGCEIIIRPAGKTGVLLG
jgi:hypothetical protein